MSDPAEIIASTLHACDHDCTDPMCIVDIITHEDWAREVLEALHAAGYKVVPR